MSTNLKQDIINAVRKGNCPDYRRNSHACWICFHMIPVTDTITNTINYICGNSKYDKKTYKVKPKKVKGVLNNVY